MPAFTRSESFTQPQGIFEILFEEPYCAAKQDNESIPFKFDKK